MKFLLTVDVELINLEDNNEDSTLVETIDKKTFDLLSLFQKHDVEATFYYTGNYAELKPDTIKFIHNNGHEIGCHSYSHDPNEMLDILQKTTQESLIKKAKKILTDIVTPIYSFKAPELRIGFETPKILIDLGFKYDSSVSSQRFDFFLSHGIKNKINWMISPRKPYFLSASNPYHIGNTKLLEIPVSAFIFPYIGTTMRISPYIFNLLEKILFREAKRNDGHLLFIFHPNECIELNEMSFKTRTTISKNILAGNYRQNIKYRNLGKQALILLEYLIIRAKAYGFEFTTISKYGSTF